MATAEFLTDRTDGATAFQFGPGVATPILTAPQVLPSEQLQRRPAPGGLSVTFLSGPLNPRPDVVQFAAIRDPRLRLIKAIPLNVSREESAFRCELARDR